MEKRKSISMAVIKRLPKYHRYLRELMDNEVDRISSKELSQKIGFTASQIRQDLNCFGDFGQQGYGYNVKALYNEISNILGLDREYKIVIIGAGNIGQALANYNQFAKLGFVVAGIFDANPKLSGIQIRDIAIEDIDNLEDFLDKNSVDIGVICVPKVNAQKVADRLINKDIKAIWNFAPLDLEVPDDVTVENVNLSESMLTLVYLLNQNN